MNYLCTRVFLLECNVIVGLISKASNLRLLLLFFYVNWGFFLGFVNSLRNAMSSSCQLLLLTFCTEFHLQIETEQKLGLSLKLDSY